LPAPRASTVGGSWMCPRQGRRHACSRPRGP
jgi:hypothetical protein